MRSLASSSDLPPRLSLSLVVAVLLGTLILCTYDMRHTPPGVASDALQDVGDGFRISRGIPFPADFTDRPEMPYRFWIAAWLLLLGPHIFAAQVSQTFVALLTIALTYRAGLSVLAGWRWQRLGSLVAAGAMAAIPPYLFIVRSPYRAILVPPVVLLVVITLLRAYRRGQHRHWATTGFWASCGLQTYLAGIAVPIWTATVVGFMLIIPARAKRFRWSQALCFVLGA